jgi:hypothetical protein
VTYSDDALPVVVHGCSTSVGSEGIELSWEAFGYGDLGEFDIYRLEVAEGDSCGGRAIPSGAVRVNAVPLAGAERMEYLDSDVEAGKGYCYWLRWSGPGGEQREYWCGRAVASRVSLGDGIRGVYPNPSGEGIWIEYEVGVEGEVVFEIYDVRGRLVKVEGIGVRARGIYEGESGYSWDGRGSGGERVPSGVYVVRMLVGGRAVASAKAVILP